MPHRTMTTARSAATDTLAALLLCAAIYEGALGAGQMAGLWQSGNPRYLLTGTYGNPGPYACLMAMLLPLAAGMVSAGRHSRLLYIAGWAVVALCAVVLPASLSRTAWIAAVAGLAVVWCDRLRGLDRRIVIAAGIVAVILAAGAYTLKARSADGRWLMWRIAATAMAEVPATGTGWDNVMGAYGNAQEQYFASARRSGGEIMTADVPEYVFNEYLRVGIAYGPAAMAAMVVLTAGAATAAWRGGRRDVAGSIVAAAVTMAASYPLHYTLSTAAIATLMVLGYASGRRWPPVRLAGAALTVAAALAIVHADSHSAARTVRHEFELARALHSQGRYRESNAVLSRLTRLSADPMILNITGNNHKALGMTDSAAHYYRRAADRCPNRLYPHYLLMRLWADTGDSTAMRAEARVLLAMPEKVSSPATVQMKKEALELSGIR